MKTLASTSICILAFSKVANDPRVLKQVRICLDLGFRVSVVGYGSTSRLHQEVKFFDLRRERPAYAGDLGLVRRVARAFREPRILKGKALQCLRRAALWLGLVIPPAYLVEYWLHPTTRGARDAARRFGCDIYLANDIRALPAALAAAGDAPVIYDAHEYAQEQHAGAWASRVFRNPYKRYLSLRYIPRTTRMTTVSDGIADLYERDTGIRPEVIRNVPYYQPSEFRPTDPSEIRMIHHGAAISQRQLEVMIEAMAFLPERFSLTFMLTRPDSQSERYVEFLRERAARIGEGRIVFRDPVPLREVHSALEEYDIGFFVRPVGDTHRRFALPNKLFQFIMAGLCVVIGPSPEMVRIVEEHGCGVVIPSYDPKDVGEVLAGLPVSEIDAHKRGALAATKELNAEKETEKLGELLAELAPEAMYRRAATQRN